MRSANVGTRGWITTSRTPAWSAPAWRSWTRSPHEAHDLGRPAHEEDVESGRADALPGQGPAVPALREAGPGEGVSVGRLAGLGESRPDLGAGRAAVPSCEDR